MALPFISIIIPVKPGGEVRSVAPLSSVDYPTELMEIIVAEGRQPSVQRNRAAEQAKGEIIFFLDDDSLVPKGLFRMVVGKYEDPAVSAVGGPILTPDTDTLMQKGYGLALASIFGGSSIRGRYKKLGAERDATENDLILANMSFRRKVFLDAGGFNENLYPNEENELMNRLQAEGHKFLYVPDAFLYRSQRTSYRLFLKQVFTYGRGRMDQNYAHPEGFKPLHVVPSAFLLYALSLLFIHNYVYFLPAILYLSLCGVFAVGAGLEARANGWRNLLIFLVMPWLFISLHLGYGAGFLWGALKGAKGKPAPYTGGVNIRRVAF
ncbi:MAG: glycosyltransferase [Nitrospirae bacterium]|nr:glycosyltransferase [Nitrospirota bacterium]MBI5695192.1 glycosyltransferase [Nitrospirota bacterium]